MRNAMHDVLCDVMHDVMCGVLCGVLFAVICDVMCEALCDACHACISVYIYTLSVCSFLIAINQTLKATVVRSRLGQRH